MENHDKIIITQDDFQKISSLVKTARPEIAEPLEEELSRAQVVPNDELPKDVVSMNSQVVFQDLDTKKESVVTLVFPQDAKVEENKISVLAPIGSALIGLKVGQTIQWPLPNGKHRNLVVVSIKRQG